MSPHLQKKIAAVLLHLESEARRERDFNTDIQYMLDDPDVAAWLMLCRQQGWGNANLFSSGRR
jgi:hypothetical protein